MRRVGRAVALRGLGCAVLAALAGCTSTVPGEAFRAEIPAAKPTVPPAGPEGADPAAPPVVGTCFTLTLDQALDPLASPPPVNCADEHNAETADVADTGLGPDEPYPTPSDLAQENGDVAVAVEDVCSFEDITEYLGGDELDDPYAFYAAFLPSEEQWAAGARWVRCDVHYGYLEPETAPGVMAGALEGDEAAAYRACFAGNPADYDVVPCSQPHDAEPVGGYVDLPVGTPYPADPAARQAIAGECLDDIQAYVDGPMPIGYAADVYVGPSDGWSEAPYARCVVVPAGGGRSSTSVRP